MGRRRGRSGGPSVADVYDALAPSVLGYFRSHRMQDPEGLTGDVFVAVTERLADFSGDEAALRRWVFTIAHHRRVDEIRRAGRRPMRVDTEPEPAPTTDPDPFDPELVDALARLTPEQREVVVLRFVADLGVGDVAELTDRSEGAVKMLQSRAMSTLRHHLTDQEESSGPP